MNVRSKWLLSQEDHFCRSTNRICHMHWLNNCLFTSLGVQKKGLHRYSILHIFLEDAVYHLLENKIFPFHNREWTLCDELCEFVFNDNLKRWFDVWNRPIFRWSCHVDIWVGSGLEGHMSRVCRRNGGWNISDAQIDLCIWLERRYICSVHLKQLMNTAVMRRGQFRIVR